MKRSDLAPLVDLTAVGPDTTADQVRRLAADVAAYGCRTVYTLPSFTPLLLQLLRGRPDITVGGAVGFPSGAVTTRTKVAELLELVAIGCGEFDMVMNFGSLLSADYALVREDIRQVKEAAGGRIVKVILETHYLSDDQIRRGCELCLEGGADFIKTSTGWAPTGATVHAVSLIRAVVGDRIGIKAAGGIRQLSLVDELYAAGARRFGLGLSSAERIFSEAGE